MGQREGLSFMDVKTANDLYQCSGKIDMAISSLFLFDVSDYNLM